MVYQVLKNDRVGWQAIWGQLRNDMAKGAENPEKEYSFAAELNEENDVSNLRYFLPLHSFLRRKGKTAILHLSGRENMLRRAEQFLSILYNYGDLLVTFGDMAGTQREKICAAYLERDKDLTPGERVLVSCVLAGMEEKLTPEGLYEYTFTYPRERSRRANGDYLINYNLLKQAICAVPNTKPNSVEQLKVTSYPAHQMDVSDLLPLVEFSEDTSVSEHLLEELIGRYQAYAEENLGSDLQKRWTKIIPPFDGNRLAELIFYFMLRNLCQSKRVGKSSQEWSENDITLLQKTALDAKSYAEGLWQAIENAHLHSCGKVAYFGMRIYKAEVESSMFELPKEVNTRYTLWRKYWLPQTRTQNNDAAVNTNDNNNIFNLRTSSGKRVYTDFIEFYVLDDAIGENGNPEGILKKIRDDQNDLKQEHELSRISDIFQLSEEDYEGNQVNFYIRHYGMRWLRMHADRLNAIMQIYSPHYTEPITYREKHYVRQKDLGGFCFSNIFPDGCLLMGSRNPSADALALVDDGKAIGRIKAVAKDTITLTDDRVMAKHQLELLYPYPECYSTEYSILIPLAYSSGPDRKPLAGGKRLIFGGDESFYRDVEVRFIEPDFTPPLLSANKKEEVIHSLMNQFSPTGEDGVRLTYLSLGKCSTHQIELLAKALFACIYTRAKSAGHDGEESIRPFLFALDFDTQKDLISEFVRIFSIFYLKQGTNEYMEKVQIALCSRAADNNRREVNFVLAGKTIRSAYHTANSFVYHNADSSLYYVPLLDYLAPPNDLMPTDAGKKTGKSENKDKENLESIVICPFDLILADGEDGNVKRASRHAMCWFLRQMKEKLDTDQRTSQYGCKLSDVHVRLGSKIHIDNFYEAELLFHNMGHINRFAYLIAGDIAKDLPENAGHIFLVGYENYSSVLLQTVAQLLAEHGRKENISWVIDTRSAGKFPSVSFDKFTQEERAGWKEDETILCYTVIPIGSTMSTVHKLLASFRRGFSVAVGNKTAPKITAGKHYAVVAVGNCFVPGRALTEIEASYLKEGAAGTANTDNTPAPTTEYWHTCTLQPHFSTEEEIEVHYCLWAETQWHAPFNTVAEADSTRSWCDSIHPLIQVDKTSTLLSAIFQTPLSREALDYYNREIPLSPGSSANSTLNLLRPEGTMRYLRYGHIVQGDNHYQFYFDFENITHKPEIQKALTKWARGITVDADAYNIVISPLQMSNAVFLKTVLDNVFGSNLHLLHIDINGTGKETIRTKFEYISMELKRISNAYSKVHFYYVDDSICTGTTIQRAYKFFLMLCEQAGVELSKLFPGNKSFKFQKVFLLVNRNSYETAQMWVQNPRKDWCGFINLCVPSYNTHSNTCPACHVRDRFQLLSKRSATNELTQYFSRSAIKHQARGPAEFDRHLMAEIRENPGYLDWLCLYVRSHETGMDNTEYQALRDSLLENPGACRGKSLRDVFADNDEAACRLILHIIGQEHFLRLYTMDRAYRKLVYQCDLQNAYRRCTEEQGVDPKKPEFTAYQTKLMQELLSLFCEALDSSKNRYDQIMAFTSYIKVISRDYIVRNYFIRNAIYEALHCILILLIEPIEQESLPLDSSQDAFVSHFKKPCDDEMERTFRLIICQPEFNAAFYQIWRALHPLESSKEVEADLFYRVFKITSHRLALLHSPFIIRDSVALNVYNAYQEVRDTCPTAAKAYAPSFEELMKTYIASIKTATMAEDDDGMCYNLLGLGSEDSGK